MPGIKCEEFSILPRSKLYKSKVQTKDILAGHVLPNEQITDATQAFSPLFAKALNKLLQPPLDMRGPLSAIRSGSYAASWRTSKPPCMNGRRSVEDNSKLHRLRDVKEIRSRILVAF